jgi:thiol:disulfide interchange protein DsbG
MLKKKLIGLAVIAATLSSTAAFAAASAPAAASAAEAPYSGPVPAVLQAAAAKGGLTVYNRFDATHGMHGWVVKDHASSKYVIVYTTPDDGLLLAGMLVDESGQNLTSMFSQKYIPATDYAPIFKKFTTEAASVVWGKPSAKAEVVIGMDPNCIFCQRTEHMLKPAVDDGALKVVLVPVGILGHDSPQRAAGLLVSKDVNAYMDADVVAGEFTGNVPTSTDSSALAKVTANTKLFEAAGFTGTPAIMYMSGTGKDQTLNVSPGVPNMTEMFTKLGLQKYIEKSKSQDPAFGAYFR